MKRYIYIAILGLAVAFVYSCKRSEIQDLKLPDSPNRSITGEGIVIGDVSKDNAYVKIPFKISLSGPASEAFQVGITLNNDTVSGLISSGALTNAVLLPAAQIEYPNVINVAYGTTEATGVATVRLFALERNYGKKIAFAFKLTQPGKGNVIAGGKSNIMVVLNTSEYLKQSDLHYVSIGNGGIYDVMYKGPYDTSPAGATIYVPINLANQPSSAFNVKVVDNIDTIASLKTSGVLDANTIHLDSGKYTIDTIARLGTGIPYTNVRIFIPWPTFDANILANKKFAFVLQLKNPTNHVLDPNKKTVVVIVDPNVNLDNSSQIIGNGTGLKAQYWTNTQTGYTDGVAPFVTRVDGTIEFNGDGWPDGVKNAAGQSLSRDNFSSRWTGEFLAPVRGEYIFYQTRWDDGSKLFINGKAIIDDYTTTWDQPSRNAKITLERGIRYKIEAWHRENVGGQQAYLEYEVPSAGINGKRVVPKTQLFPAP